MRLSGSVRDSHSWLDTFFFRFLSKRRISSSVGSWIPCSAISPFTYSFQSWPVSLRTMFRIAALASSVVASTATVLPEQLLLLGDLQHEGEDALVDLQGQPLPDDGQAGVVRRRLGQGHAEEGPQRQAIAAPPGDGPLRVEALEVADEEHAEVGAGRDGLAADTVGVVWLAEGLDEVVEAGLGEEAVELVVEDVARGARQVGGRDPQVRLSLFRPPAHRHGESLAQKSETCPPTITRLSKTFSTGC